MAPGLVCSPRKKIPLFQLMVDSSGNRYVEYYINGDRERIEMTTLIIFLVDLKMVSANLGKMIYSPKNKLPLGVLKRDKNEIYFIEVKHHDKKDVIRLSSYLALMLNSEALKAS